MTSAQLVAAALVLPTTSVVGALALAATIWWIARGRVRARRNAAAPSTPR